MPFTLRSLFQQPETVQTMPLTTLLSAYIETLKGNHDTYRFARQLHDNHFRSWEQPTFAQIEDWVKAHADRPHLANKGLGVLKAAYNWGIRRGLHHGVNPAQGVKRCRVYSRERVLSPGEIALVLASLDHVPIKLAAVLVVLLTTGCRLGEAVTMRRNLVNMTTGQWTQPRTKNGKTHTTYLSTQAREWLAKLPSDSDYFFQGHYGHHYSRCGAEKLWRELRSQLGIDARLHDFRRSLATHLYLATRDEYLVKRCINHVQTSVTAIYVRIGYEEVATALQAQADRFFALPLPVKGIVSTPPPKNFRLVQ